MQAIGKCSMNPIKHRPMGTIAWIWISMATAIQNHVQRRKDAVREESTIKLHCQKYVTHALSFSFALKPHPFFSVLNTSTSAYCTYHTCPPYISTCTPPPPTAHFHTFWNLRFLQYSPTGHLEPLYEAATPKKGGWGGEGRREGRGGTENVL